MFSQSLGSCSSLVKPERFITLTAAACRELRNLMVTTEGIR